MCFKRLFKLSYREKAQLHWFHLFDFSQMYVFKCLLKWPSSYDAKLCWLHLFLFDFSHHHHHHYHHHGTCQENLNESTAPFFPLLPFPTKLLKFQIWERLVLGSAGLAGSLHFCRNWITFVARQKTESVWRHSESKECRIPDTVACLQILWLKSEVHIKLLIKTTLWRLHAPAWILALCLAAVQALRIIGFW